MRNTTHSTSSSWLWWSLPTRALPVLAFVPYEDMVLFGFCFTQDFVACGRTIARQLKRQHKGQLVIALTHMRMVNDLKLADQVPEIDLELGGHDHDYAVCRSRYL